MKFIALFFIILFLFFVGCKAKEKSKEKKFWNWVIENNAELENFIKSNHDDYSIYYQLTNRIKEYNSFLFPEMTLTKNNEVVLIITPDGMSEGILPTENLYNSKPELENWIIKKFRQASDEIKLNYNGVEFPSSDIKIIPELDKKRGKINIQVYIRNMNSDIENHQALSFLYLDHILGEYNTITRVGYISFFHLDNDKNVKNSISVLELRKMIEKEFISVE